MKRILSFLSLAALTGFSLVTIAGCAEKDTPTTNTPTVEPTVEKIAQDLIQSIILEQDGRVVDEDFSLLSQLTRDGKTYPITWASNKPSVKIGAKDDATFSYAVAVNRNVAAEETVTLTATIKVSDTDTATRDFTVLVQPYELYDFIENYKFALEGGNLWQTYELDTEVALPNAPEKATIEWSCTGENSELITINKAADGKVTLTAAIKFDKYPAQLTAKFTYKGETAEVKYDVNVFQQTIYTMENEVAKDTEYYFAMLQKNLENSYLWFNGTASEGRLNTTRDITKAKKVQVEEVTGGFNLFFMDKDAKKYINVAEDKKLTLDAAAKATCHYEWDAEHKTLLIKAGKETYFFGTHGTYNTISVSDMKYINKGNFIANFYKPATIDSEQPTFPDQALVDHECSKFTMSTLLPGKTNLQLKGKKFDNVTIKYTLAEPSDVVTLAKDGKSVDVKAVTTETTVKFSVDFSLGKATASKDVEVKIPVVDTLAVDKFIAAKKGTVAFISGKVVAAEKDSFILQDASGLICVRTKDSGFKNPELGKTVKFVGLRDDNYGYAQAKPRTALEVVTDLTLAATEPKVYTKTELDAAMKADPVCEYVAVTGKLELKGYYINVTLEGTENFYSIKGSKDLVDAMKIYDGLNVTIKGYTGGTNTKTHYLTVIMSEFTCNATEAEINVAKVAAAKKAVEAVLPAAPVADKTVIELPALHGVELTVTAANTLAYDAGTKKLTITPTAEATADELTIVFKLGEATETLKVTINAKMLDNDTFKFSTDYNKTATAIEGGFKFVQGDATIEQVKGTSTNNVVNDKAEMRVYKGHKLTITSTKNIKKIVMITTKYDKFTALTASIGDVVIEESTVTWTGDSKTVSFDNTDKQGRVVTLIVYYE